MLLFYLLAGPDTDEKKNALIQFRVFEKKSKAFFYFF